VWRLNKHHHVGLIVRSPSFERVAQLVDSYRTRFVDDFAATLPPRTTAMD
jgi:hypothetical protein